MDMQRLDLKEFLDPDYMHSALFQFSGFTHQDIIKPSVPQQVLNSVNPASDEQQHMTCYNASLFIEQKLRQNTGAVCGKLSEPHDPTACRSTFSSGAHTLNLETADAVKSSPEPLATLEI